MDCLNMFKLSMLFTEPYEFSSLAFPEEFAASSYSPVTYSGVGKEAAQNHGNIGQEHGVATQENKRLILCV
jgi:hypothetical protein